jgi:hypothetical protein
MVKRKKKVVKKKVTKKKATKKKAVTVKKKAVKKKNVTKAKINKAALEFASTEPKATNKCQTCSHSLANEFSSIVAEEVREGRSRQTIRGTFGAIKEYCEKMGQPYSLGMSGFLAHWNNCLEMKD